MQSEAVTRVISYGAYCPSLNLETDSTDLCPGDRKICTTVLMQGFKGKASLISFKWTTTLFCN